MHKIEHTRSIGDGFLTTGTRVYKSNNMKLSTWAQRRCVICNVFLSNLQRKFCSKHGFGSKEFNQYNRDRNHKWDKTFREANPEYNKLRRLVREHPERFNVGDIV